MAKDDMDHLQHLAQPLEEDHREILRKEGTYRGSWKKRGGVGAFMMLARKWDRLEQMAEDNGYDIFKAVGHDLRGEDGSAIAEIRDLRRYLALVEAEMVSEFHKVYPPETPSKA